MKPPGMPGFGRKGTEAKDIDDNAKDSRENPTAKPKGRRVYSSFTCPSCGRSGQTLGSARRSNCKTRFIANNPLLLGKTRRTGHSDTTGNVPSGAPPAERRLPPGCAPAVDAEGRIYYYMPGTQRAQWEFPVPQAEQIAEGPRDCKEEKGDCIADRDDDEHSCSRSQSSPSSKD